TTRTRCTDTSVHSQVARPVVPRRTAEADPEFLPEIGPDLFEPVLDEDEVAAVEDEARTHLNHSPRDGEPAAGRGPVLSGVPGGAGDLLLRVDDAGVGELAGNPRNHGEVGRAEHQHVDARDGGDLLGAVHRMRLFELDDDERLFVRLAEVAVHWRE